MTKKQKRFVEEYLIDLNATQAAIRAGVARDKYMNTSELQSILRDEIAQLMEESHRSTENFGLDVEEGVPYVIMVVGVNGAGKTTTIGKLAAQLTRAGLNVYIGAADTFRAAAIDQLAVWAERAGATMIRQEMGSDPASVAFDTLKSAVANKADVYLKPNVRSTSFLRIRRS